MGREATLAQVPKADIGDRARQCPVSGMSVKTGFEPKEKYGGPSTGCDERKYAARSL